METPPASSAKPWPRSAQITVGVLLALCLFLLAGKTLLRSLEAGPATLPAQRFDLNRATQAELMVLPGVGDQLAERIARMRADKGPFQKVDDLRQVPGVGPATLERMRPWLFVSAAVAPTTSPRDEPPTRPGAKPSKGTNLTDPIDINSASAALLMQLPGIGPKLSERIIKERDHKPFLSVAELRRVPGIGPKTLEKVRHFVTVSTVNISRR